MFNKDIQLHLLIETLVKVIKIIIIINSLIQIHFESLWIQNIDQDVNLNRNVRTYCDFVNTRQKYHFTFFLYIQRSNDIGIKTRTQKYSQWYLHTNRK